MILLRQFQVQIIADLRLYRTHCANWWMSPKTSPQAWILPKIKPIPPTLINLYLVLPLDCPWIDAVKSSACPALSILECLARDGKTNCFIVVANCFVTFVDDRIFWRNSGELSSVEQCRCDIVYTSTSYLRSCSSECHGCSWNSPSLFSAYHSDSQKIMLV